MHKLPSNRKFGFTMSVLLVFLSAYMLVDGVNIFSAFAGLFLSFSLCFAAVISPDSLALLNRCWMKLGELIGKVINPLVLGVIFFVLITPIALIVRLFGRDELRLKRKITDSHWIDRVPPGPAGESFKNQF